MGDILGTIGLLCSPGAGWAGVGLPAGLLLAGLAGSLMHCGPMCGPFVLGQVADRMARLPAARLSELRRLTAALLLPYHAGRLTTYAALGALAGATGGALVNDARLHVVSAALLLAAAALFALHAARRLLPGGLPALFARRPPRLVRLLERLEHAPPGWTRMVRRATRRFGRGGFPLGLALGFLPCGFLYAALMAAAASLNPLGGALAMLAFGAGTVPALAAVGMAGNAARRHFGPAAARVVPAVLLLNAVLLGLLAWRSMSA